MDAATRTTHRVAVDVAIVGARAAGGALGILLARMGHDVVVLDRAQLPSDTLSTHSIARSGVVQLHRWGLLGEVLASGAPAIRQVTFHTSDGARSLAIKDRAGVDVLVAPRRHVLDTIVARAAARSGAALRLGETVTDVHRDAAGRVTGLRARGRDGDTVDLDAAIVVGADGVRSHVARSVGARLVDERPADGAAYYAYYGGVPWSGIELFVADGMLAGVFPTHCGEACIWLCAPADDVLAVRRDGGSVTAGFERLLERRTPALAARLGPARRTSPVRGAVRLPNQVRQAFGPGWALVGDALYHRDPITGHGISDAYRDAELLATALETALRGERSFDDALEDYRRRADDARREIFDITCALAGFPPVPRFVELERQLSAAIDVEAAALAAQGLATQRLATQGRTTT
jgi:flavin-dependent dehydrogenase